MKTLKKFEFPAASTAIKAIYNWDKLLDGGIYQLTDGEDFKCKPATFAMMARNQAKKRGITVKVAKVDGGTVIQAGPARSDADKSDE